MFNKDTNKATNCPRAVLEAFSGESKDQGQFIRAICNYAQNASLTNRYMLRQRFLYYESNQGRQIRLFGYNRSRITN